MKILALETSAKAVSAAVVENGAVLASTYQNLGLTHSVTLMPMVDTMLKNAGMTAQDMALIAVAAGPAASPDCASAYRRQKDWLGPWASPAAVFPRWRPWQKM